MNGYTRLRHCGLWADRLSGAFQVGSAGTIPLGAARYGQIHLAMLAGVPESVGGVDQVRSKPAGDHRARHLPQPCRLDPQDVAGMVSRQIPAWLYLAVAAGRLQASDSRWPDARRLVSPRPDSPGREPFTFNGIRTHLSRRG